MRYAGAVIAAAAKGQHADGHAPATHLTDARLDRLAELAVRVGLNLAPGQELVMTAPVEALPSSRRITEQAYRAGASLVTTLLSDDQAALARYRHAPDDSFDAAPGWLYDGMAQAFRARRGAAGDRRRRPDAARRAGPGQGGARQPRPVQGLSPGAGADHRHRHQLDPRRRRHPGLGAAVFPDLPEAEARGRGCGTRSSPPPASTGPTRSPPGRRTTRR